MRAVKIIANIISWASLPGIGLYAMYRMEHGSGGMREYYEALFGISILLFIGFLIACGYVRSSGRTRLIPEAVYFLALAGNYRILDQYFETSLMKSLIYGIMILAGIARIVLFILNSKDYHSSEAASDRRVARADYDYENAKSRYEYELKYGQKYSDQELARLKLQEAEKRQRAVHQQERK